MIAIVDYGVGNLFSLACSLKKTGFDSIVTPDPEVIRSADRIILPGVGAFEDAARKLNETGLGDVVKEEAAKGKYLMGICLGMQLLFDVSYEYGTHKGLGLIPGSIMPLQDRCPGLKVPHMGWNRLDIKKDSPVFANLPEEAYVYFVHSFYAVCDEEYITATAEYGIDVTASVRKDNIFGCQFHPEKSGDTGLGILRAFCEMR